MHPSRLDRLRELGAEVKKVEVALDVARRERDKEMRNLRLDPTPGPTVPEMAEAAGCSQGTVKTVLRGLRET